jgi:hypothetical protein
MPSYLDFDSTKKFRDFILGKTLNQPNTPDTYQNLNSFSNSNPGDVESNVSTNRTDQIKSYSGINTYKPSSGTYDDIVEDTRVLSNSLDGLKLYPYFNTVPPEYNLVGIYNTSNYETESKLFKFAADYLKNGKEGPIQSRITRNIEKATVGRVRLLDALNGNTTTAINLLTGREPLVDFNNSITVAKTLPGKAIDFLQSVAGLTFPFSEIPGDYLSNPLREPTGVRPEASTQVGKLLQDVTGVLGSIVGIERRPTLSRKPSDLLIEYMGQGPKQSLFNSLSFSKYAPNYTTTARSQNSSKIFNFIDNAAQGVRNVLGIEAPSGIAYIGDDRGNDVKFAMNDFNDRPVRSSYYLSLMFDQISTDLFHKNRNVTEGGSLSGNLTWISKNSKNKLGANNAEYASSEQTKLEDTLSTRFGFRDDSILGETQRILDSMPSDGGASRSHVANVIDQTSRLFMDGDVKISRGSAIKYTDKYNSEEAGVEYCRVWTKDRSYMNLSDTMKKTGNIRKFDASVMGGASRPWNLNMAPMSNGNKSFDGSTNIFDGYQYGGGYYAKKYMFSIENLVWKTSNRDGFRVSDLPACERGPNGGRVMWFPPYDLKISEQNSAKWEDNNFLGRPEPIYTYQNTSRSGTISFKVVVDHPSILNVMTRDLFKGMTDEESDNYINAFFAGCKDMDFYELMQTYITLDTNDVTLITDYLNGGGVDPQTITKFNYVSNQPVVESRPPIITETKNTAVNFETNLFFRNDYPKSGNASGTESSQSFNSLYNEYIKRKTVYPGELKTDLEDILIGSYSGRNGESDRKTIFGEPYPLDGLIGSAIGNKVNQIISIQTGKTIDGFTKLESGYTQFNTQIETLKTDIKEGSVGEVTLTVKTTTSEVAEDVYNFYLGVRRGYSIVSDFMGKLAETKTPNLSKKWFTKEKLDQFKNSGTPVEKLSFSFSDFGFENEGTLNIEFQTNGEKGNIPNPAGDGNLQCNTTITTKKGLKVTAPIAFFCRQSNVKINYTKKGKPQKEEVPPVNIPSGTFEPEKTVIPGTPPKKPSINLMQDVIMKLLSECYYFKKLEEDSPIAFKSLTEKLKYFHPAFHSTTPEGLNARLTFLHQCIRPGDTIPIKGISDSSDLNARNTTFGPPPICVMRIGDFYHSKIIIRDVNISYDENVWDLNPEGIGVQPMIATVTLQVTFIGGQGLEKPVERLQNALSSNFFANTEMYDPRSTITSTINGKNEEEFTKEFLEKLTNFLPKKNSSENDSAKSNGIKQDIYIGELKDTKLSYTGLINALNYNGKEYIERYKSTYNNIIEIYGNKIGGLFLSPKYRSVKDVNVYTPSLITFEMFGQYPVSKELSQLTRSFKTAITASITSNNIGEIIGFNDVLPTKIHSNSETILKPYISKFVIEIINKFTEITSLKELEDKRNEVIEIIDKFNYIITNSEDGKIVNPNYSGVTLDSFIVSDFYKEYSPTINHLTNNHSVFTEDLDITSIDFESTTSYDTSTLSELLSILLKDKKFSDFVTLYKDPIFLPYHEKMRNKFEIFVATLNKKKFKDKNFPERTNTKEVEYVIGAPSEVTDNATLKKIFSPKNKLETTLNFYKR